MLFLDQHFMFFPMVHLFLLQVQYYVQESGGNHSPKLRLHLYMISAARMNMISFLRLHENEKRLKIYY
jgi:hypothetical protein